ncbi:hypothetical protein F0919_16445 [Taibaiella lutea]|uniref:Fungal lipase-type domain-containing protein n=1 Tax=Taibaiella lutea TaxID=2608001 RepID=A0A5M6CD45_9BACT|nr:hypothetical protein [Taibaiella lutea]KAA5532380.1 hypothetical protein F0919_16445 [Taibaiella lutea]
MASYPLEAQIHSLSLISNAAFDLQESSYDQLQTVTTTIVTNCLADLIIQGCIGDWTIVWGPKVFTNNQTAAKVVADNTMMLVYNQSSNQFVVGIAGTNAVSMYGWFQEDFGVNTLVEWSKIVNKNINIPVVFVPVIAGGTYLGLQNLLAMEVSGVTMLSALNTYVQENKITGATVNVAGHSLGGALTPVMAMYMQDTQATWNTVSGSITTIAAWPTAGPTPGNVDFATYVAKHMGANYVSRYNPIDVVPQAWMYSSMENIPGIYPQIQAPEPQAPYYTTMGLLTLSANLRAINTSDGIRTDYQQIQPWNQLTGCQFDTNTDNTAKIEANVLNVYATGNLAPYKPYFKAFYEFICQLGYQHTTAYNDPLGITAVAAEMKIVKQNATNETDDVRRVNNISAALSKYYGMSNINVASLAAAQTQTASQEAEAVA